MEFIFMSAINIDSSSIVEIITADNVDFEVIKIPETIYAGNIGYSQEKGNEPDINLLWAQMFWYDQNSAEWKNPIDEKITGKVTPTWEAIISIDYWRGKDFKWGMMFAREVNTVNQPEGVYVHVQPETTYIRVHCDEKSAKLLGKEKCAAYELFNIISSRIIPEHGYVRDESWQEIEYLKYPGEQVRNSQFINAYAYVPVKK
jgi:hypothetical protein